MTGNQAGQSADDVARRTRDKIARLERAAAAWEAGSAGEKATGQVLAALDPATWRVLHDVRWPGRARANIDHVVIGPPGVFVIDSKNWSGSVAVAGGVLRQNGRSRENAVAGVAEAGIAIYELVPDTPVHPVLCLVRDEPAEGWVRDVMLCSTANLLPMITTRTPALSPADVRRVAARVETGLARPVPVASRSRSPRPASSRRAAAGRSSRDRSGPSVLRLLGFLLMVALLLGALQTGAFSALASKISEVVVGQVVDEQQPADTPAEKPGKRRQRDVTNRSD